MFNKKNRIMQPSLPRNVYEIVKSTIIWPKILNLFIYQAIHLPIQQPVIMYRKFLFLAFVLPAFLTAQSTVTRSLSAFSRISVSGGYDEVILKEGNAESVSMTVSGIDPDRITTEVEDGQLKIGMKRGSYSNFKARIVVTYRKIEALGNSGSSNITAESVIKADQFKMSSSGSGDFKGEFDVAKLKISISGSSDMKLKGVADEQEISISGSGDVKADQLRGKSAEVSISGSGDVELNVSGNVRTRVSGSGNVNNNN